MYSEKIVCVESAAAGLAFRLVSARVMKKRKINTLREISTLLFSTVCSQRIQLSIWPISMDDCIEVAGFDGRKLVENYQGRFLWQIFDDVISNFLLNSLTPPLNGFNATINAKVSVQLTRDHRTGLNRRKSWIRGIHSMAHRCLLVCVGGHGWILGIHFSIQCRWILLMHSMDSMQKICARFQWKSYQ